MMAVHEPVSRERSRGPWGFRVIGAMKLGSGLLLFAAWLGMFRLFKGDLGADLDWLVRHLELDPDSRVFHKAIAWVGGLDRKYLRAIEAGTFFYAVLHTIEGTGLLLEYDWAGYLTVIATSALVPFEFYELVQKTSSPKIMALKALVLIVNLGLVAYVVFKLRQERQQRAAQRAASTGFPESRV